MQVHVRASEGPFAVGSVSGAAVLVPTGARLAGDGRMILPSVRAVLLLIDSMRDAHGARAGAVLDQERSA